MAEIIYVTGGARSGKSTFAEKLLSQHEKVLYLATAQPFDDEMRSRIRAHQKQRNPHWDTLEAFADFPATLPPRLIGKSALLLDCMTLLVSNCMLRESCDWGKLSPEEAVSIEQRVQAEVDGLFHCFEKFDGKVVIVSNETGMGIVPETALCRLFRDIAGRVNQRCAAISSQAWLLVSGIPLQLKGES